MNTAHVIRGLAAATTGLALLAGAAHAAPVESQLPKLHKMWDEARNERSPEYSFGAAMDVLFGTGESGTATNGTPAPAAASRVAPADTPAVTVPPAPAR